MADHVATLRAAQAWVADDPDPVTQQELRDLLDAVGAEQPGAADELADRFTGLLQFGTAGLRGRVGAGPARMNRAVVMRAAWALVKHLEESLEAAGHGGRATVVIGYDARHRSDDFARDTAAIVTGAGHRAILLPGRKPTPVLAYATRALGADAGVMVTASHNPAWDNGYKVYLGERVTPEAPGAQLVGPHDGAIADHMARIRSVAEIPYAETGWEELGPDIVDEYVAKAAAVVPAPTGDVAEARAAVRVILTPIHGVGDETVRAALGAAGFTDLTTVPEQAEPDPDFPTVAFPNPEEPGAMDLALKLATDRDADVVIANDPDTDRCAVATVIDGGWQMLHGDVVGCLLGQAAGQRLARLRIAPGTLTLANSVVSSQLLGRIAAAHGMRHAHTLTGFKWIARAERLAYGYEEALGYCVAPDLVLDKDGITAAVMVADLVASLKASGRTLADAIDDLDREHGVYLTRQVSARFDDLAVLRSTMDGLLAAPPASLGGSRVSTADDMSAGLGGLPPTTGLHLRTEAGARVIVRPSGTEPKVKAYLEVFEPGGEDGPRDARGRAGEAMAALEADVKAALGVA